MNIRKKIAAAAMACLIGTVVLSGHSKEQAYAAEKPAYLKSVTYFGDEWPINYWGSEDKDMAANFEKIREDGFNSIILVVPWREFQPAEGMNEFNDAAFNRLDEVMQCAEDHGLWVVLRIGYSWDYYGTAELPSRFAGITRKTGAERSMWIRYCNKIYQTASAHSNFHSGFITWEDFWDYVHNMGREYSKKTASKMARECGYQDYLAEHYTLEEVSEKYNEEFGSFADVYIPYRDKPSAALFFEYYDQMLNELLAHSQTVFPGLSMEVRADSDPVYTTDNSFYYYSHKATFPCDGADYSAVMYSVSMGQRNEYDRISAQTALAGTARTLTSLCEKSGKKMYAEQLLYMDTTAEFSYNTQILEDETDDYVRSLAPVLQQYTMGYGLWVYRNYVNNCVYNGQFGLEKEGWKFLGGSSVETVNGTPMAKVGGNRKIFQQLNGRMTKGAEIYVELYVKPEVKNADVTVQIGGESKQIHVTKAGTYELTFPWQSDYNIEISSNKVAFVDDVRVYTYEQFGRIYDKDGNEQDLANDFRILNGQLP